MPAASQTEGDDLPEAPVSRLLGSDPDDRYTQLRRVAHSLGFSVEEDYLAGEVNGDCDHGLRRIRVEVRNDERQQVKTLAHELAHAILHANREQLTRERAEMEAESVAYIVCHGLGIDSSEYSFGYVASWTGGGDEARRAISESAERIQRAAKRILDAAGKEDQAAA